MLCSLDLMLQRSYQRECLNMGIALSDQPKAPPVNISFITLTIASLENMDLNQAYKLLLAPWLRYMKRKQGLTEYVWKAEYQRRGQVHYHIATPKYIDWKVVRWQWNKLQRKHRMLDKFALKFGHFNPNSTDIHAMYEVDDALSYMAKEMGKKVQNQKKGRGKVWDCNQGLKGGRYTCLLGEENEERLDEIMQFDFGRKVECDHCVVLKTPNPTAVLTKRQKAEYNMHLR